MDIIHNFQKLTLSIQNVRKITQGTFIEKTFKEGVFQGVVVQLTNGFTKYSKELHYHVIYVDGDSEDLSGQDVMSLMITDPIKIAQAKQNQYTNRDNTISYNEANGVTYAPGHEPDLSVCLLHLPSLKSNYVGMTAKNSAEVSTKNESVNGNQGESVNMNQGEFNAVTTANAGSNSERLNVAESIGGNDSKGFRLNMGKFKKQMVSVDSHSIAYYQSAAFQGSDQSILRVVFVQLPNVLWYFKVGFLKMVLENIFDDDVPLWVSSMKDIFIRKQPHGPNQLSRKKKTNGDMSYPKTIIMFTHKVTHAASSLESHSLNYAIAKLHNIFTNTEGLNEALHSWSTENQAGVISYFQKKEPTMQKILEKFDKDIQAAFKSKRIVNTNTALDKFMLDWDIKQFVASDLGYSHWPHDKISSIFGGANSGSSVPDFDNVQQLTLND